MATTFLNKASLFYLLFIYLGIEGHIPVFGLPGWVAVLYPIAFFTLYNSMMGNHFLNIYKKEKEERSNEPIRNMEIFAIKELTLGITINHVTILPILIVGLTYAYFNGHTSALPWLIASIIGEFIYSYHTVNVCFRKYIDEKKREAFARTQKTQSYEVDQVAKQHLKGLEEQA